MPTMAPIVVKNAANVDVTFAAVSSSSGDKVPATWAVTASSTIRANRQKASLEIHDNGSGTSRVGVCQIMFPQLQTVDGVERIANTLPLKVVISIPKTIPDNLVTDYVTIGLNFAAAALVKSSFAEQVAPRS